MRALAKHRALRASPRLASTARDPVGHDRRGRVGIHDPTTAAVPPGRDHLPVGYSGPLARIDEEQRLSNVIHPTRLDCDFTLSDCSRPSLRQGDSVAGFGRIGSLGGLLEIPRRGTSRHRSQPETFRVGAGFLPAARDIRQSASSHVFLPSSFPYLAEGSLRAGSDWLGHCRLSDPCPGSLWEQSIGPGGRALCRS